MLALQALVLQEIIITIDCQSERIRSKQKYHSDIRVSKLYVKRERR